MKAISDMKERHWFPIHLTVILLLITGSLPAAEPVYPLWNGSEAVAEYAKRVSLSPTRTLDLGNGVRLELLLIPAGKFVMGSPVAEKPIVGQTMVGISVGALFAMVVLTLVRTRQKRAPIQFSISLMLLSTFTVSIGFWGGVRWNDASIPRDLPDEHPAHLVTLTQPFYMGKFPVTQEQYQQVIGNNPSHFKGKDHPVERVSRADAQKFCTALAGKTKQHIRLPTEAEWEYSCRAGTTTSYHSGDSEPALNRVAWYSVNSNRKTHPVGLKDANAFGIYDMHGNVGQWCSDWYLQNYYERFNVVNPKGPDQGIPSLRGGNFEFPALYCRSATRHWTGEDMAIPRIGFRVVVSVP